MAFNPQTGLTYIPAREGGMVIGNQEIYEWKPGQANVGSGAVFDDEYLDRVLESDRTWFRETVAGYPGLPPTANEEFLVAWDPVAQEERWRVRVGAAYSSGGGVLTTAGNLVVQGTGSGALVVYRADTGEKLHEIEIGTGIMAAPISYAIDGEQYVAVFAGAAAWLNDEGARHQYQNYGRLLAFKLGGGPTPLPPEHIPPVTPEAPPDFAVVDSVAQRGESLYYAWCFNCHFGRGDADVGAYPDLHRLSAETHSLFRSIVLEGSLSYAGMASFSDVLSSEDVDAIQSYLIREQRELRAEEQRQP